MGVLFCGDGAEVYGALTGWQNVAEELEALGQHALNARKFLSQRQLIYFGERPRWSVRRPAIVNGPGRAPSAKFRDMSPGNCLSPLVEVATDRGNETR